MPLRVTPISQRVFVHITGFPPQTRELLGSVHCTHKENETQRNEVTHQGETANARQREPQLCRFPNLGVPGLAAVGQGSPEQLGPLSTLFHAKAPPLSLWCLFQT